MSTDKLTPLGLLTIFVGLKKTGCGQIAVRMLSGRDCEVTSAANLLTDLRLSLRSLTVPFVYVTLPTPPLPSPHLVSNLLPMRKTEMQIMFSFSFQGRALYIVRGAGWGVGRVYLLSIY